MTTFKINNSQTQWTIEHQKSDVGSLRFSPDGKYLAVTCFNGYAYIRNASRSRIIGHFQVSSSNSPILSVRWCPKNQDHVLFSSADGIISSWSVQDSKELWAITENGNTVNSVDVSPSGSTFATVGSDSVVRLYDMETHMANTNLSTRSYMQGVVTGHTSRVFATLYINESLIASAGWDESVILWDARSGTAARSIFGPSVCGDGICVVNDGNTIVTGSWRAEKQLQFWDVGSGKCQKSITIGTAPNLMYIYAVAATPNQKIVACGGSKTNRVSYFRVCDYAHLAQSDVQKTEITDLHFSNKQFAFGLADSTVHVDSYSVL